MKKIKSYFYISSIAVLSVGCAGGNNPGIEYAPDMYDSKGYEPYNQLDSNQFNHLGSNLRKPADGTVAIGKADFSYSLPNNGEGYDRAASEIVRPAGLIDNNCDGQRLYNIYCTPCHGAEGKNDGKVFQKVSKLKPGAWADGYQNDYIKNLPDGQIYHTLVYGKNNMGSHSSVLTPDQRWHVIAYVRELSKGNSDCNSNNNNNTDNNEDSNNGDNMNLSDTVLQTNFEVVEVDKEEMDKIAEDLSKVEFEVGSANLKSTSIAALDDIAMLLKANDGLRILIDGHTDASGDRIKNMLLSKNRAEAVKAYLVSKGYGADRFVTNGYGSRKPIDRSGTELAKAKNRRVTFTFIK